MISEEGFLSPNIALWTMIHRKRNGAWFDLAGDLNRLGYRLRRRIEQMGSLEQWQFIACALTIKTHESFQSAVMLAERGLTSDAKSILRSAFEGLFCIGACKDSGIVERLASADRHYKKKTARGLLELPGDVGLDPAAAERMRRYLDDNPEKGEDLEIWKLAKEAGLEEVYKVYYRSLSHEAAHPSVGSLERYIAQSDTDILGFRHGPDVPDVAFVLATACVVAFYMILMMSEKMGLTDIQEAVSAEFPRYSALINTAFPDRTAGAVRA